MDRDLVVIWLAALTDKQFAEVFYESVANRDTSDFPGEQGHFVLADTSQFPGDERITQFIAQPDPSIYSDWDDHCPICQSGSCTSCGAEVRSIAKRAICPLCGEQVDCT